MQCTKSAVFRGDHEDLLDHLVSACHEHKANKPMPGFGRELVPFFGPGEDVTPLPVRSYASCGNTFSSSPRSVQRTKNPKYRKGCLAEAQMSACNSGSDLRNQTGGRVHQKYQNLQRISVSCASESDLSISSPIFASSVQDSVSSCASLTSLASSPHAAACPGFFSSPTPAAIPMPTLGFLTKARSLKSYDATQHNAILEPGLVCREFRVFTAAA